jgi:hypothetical protein
MLFLIVVLLPVLSRSLVVEVVALLCPAVWDGRHHLSILTVSRAMLNVVE